MFNTDVGGGRPNLFVRDLAGGRSRQLTFFTTDGVLAFAWSPRRRGPRNAPRQPDERRRNDRCEVAQRLNHSARITSTNPDGQ